MWLPVCTLHSLWECGRRASKSRAEPSSCCAQHSLLNSVRFVLCGVQLQSHCRSVQWKSVKLLPGITTVKQYVCEVVLLKPEQRLGRDHQSPVTQTARGRRLSFCPLAEARDCPTPSIPSLKSQIQIYQTRSLGA